MAILTQVVDRIPTYPGRVVLTPVNGQTNTYDMVRADQPTDPGTPLNKALMDQKANTLTSDVTVYVSTGGNDSTGEGTSAKPYKTINRALADLPKYLGGYTATIDIATGTYAEVVTVSGFSGGTLQLGTGSTSITVSGMVVENSRKVVSRIWKFENTSTASGSVVRVSDGSDLEIANSPTISTTSSSGKVGLKVEKSSRVHTISSTVTINGTGYAGVNAENGSMVSIYSLKGTGNGTPIQVGYGSIVRCGSSSIAGSSANYVFSGSELVIGNKSTIIAASVG